MFAEGSNEVSGRIFDIQRSSFHDGPGIRTTVFMQGCPLGCIWCHNPEGINPEPLLSFLPDLCIGCGRCLQLCPNGAHKLKAGKHIISRERCKACGLCTRECFSGALSPAGETATAAEVMSEVIRDIKFYKASRGGMTLSGGEPLSQPSFSIALLEKAKSEGIHCCCDTSGHAPWEVLERISRLVDLFLYDIKDTNPVRHKKNTGADNKIILNNLERLHDSGAEIWLRIPLIPGYNDTADNLAGIVNILRKLHNIRTAEIMPYHKLGISKLERFGMKKDDARTCEPPGEETMNYWSEKLLSTGVDLVDTRRVPADCKS